MDNIHDYLAKNRKDMKTKPLGGFEFGVRAPGLPVVPFNYTSIKQSNTNLLRTLNVTEAGSFYGWTLETAINSYIESLLSQTRAKAGFNYR